MENRPAILKDLPGIPIIRNTGYRWKLAPLIAINGFAIPIGLEPLDQTISTCCHDISKIRIVGQTKMMIEAAAEKAAELSIGILQLYIGERDEDQIELVRGAGFVEEARLSNRLRDGDDMLDMLIYTKTLSGDVKPIRESGDYYGGRKPWMLERIATACDR